MATRMIMLASEPIQQVFEKVLETSKALQSTITSVDDSNYEIEGQTATFEKHKVSTFKISLSVRKYGTLIRVDDQIERGYNSMFLAPVVNTLSKSMLVCNSIYVIQDVNPDYACTACHKEVYAIQFKSASLCPSCFYGDFYGKLLILTDNALYYGGHKAYLAGGMFSNSQSGKMYLTDYYLIFAKGDKDPSKRWEISIPLGSVNVEQWGVEEKSRRKQFSAVGGSIGDDGGFGSGVVHETGKEHHLVIAYTDENGVPQQPRFGIPSFGGKAIREWSEAVYSAVVNAKKKNQVNDVTNAKPVNDDIKLNDDPLQILKIRLAKGEITTEEYEKTRRLLE